VTDLDPVEVFRAEAAELLEQIEQGLLDLGHHLDDRDLIDAVFRGLHTLKGSGAMFGFDALAAFTHHCETAFDRVRKGDVPATPALVAAVLSARDHMRALVEEPTADHRATGDALLAQLEQAVKTAGGDSVIEAGTPMAGPEPVAGTAAGRRHWRIRFSLPENAMINGSNPLALLDELRELGDCSIAVDANSVPPLDQLAPTELHLGWTVSLESQCSRAAIEDVFIFVMDEMKLEIEGDAAEPESASVEVASAETVPSAVAETAPAAQQPAVGETAAAPAARQSRTSESVRVPAERLDELMDRVGELVIAQSRLSQIAAASPDLTLRSVAEEMERLSSELRNTMMILRMVPVATLFGRFRRLTHDLQRDTGKLIDLVTEGESTEMDKTVIERLADPLVHLVRNSADHGLESPEERVRAGKPEAGRITLSARQAGGEVMISITDDGRGVDRDRVRAKAEANGLIQPGAMLSDQELLQLIFQPGFSTAAQVTSLSGRGVGMDVVKKTIEGLRGSIDVTSEPGRGSTVALRIPLTLAIIDGLLVRVGASRYVIPLSAVEECIELSLEDDLRSRGRSFLSLRESLVPFIRLRELFSSAGRPDPYQKIIVVSTGSERVGLVVDQIIGDHQTVIRSMSKLHEDVATFAGATILGDGDVALILDVANLIALGQQQEARLRAVG
jgi:two-component system chemotaxis sensor kinase CheA